MNNVVHVRKEDPEKRCIAHFVFKNQYSIQLFIKLYSDSPVVIVDIDMDSLTFLDWNLS